MDKHKWEKVEGGWRDEEGNFLSEEEAERREEIALDTNEQENDAD